MTWVIIAWSVPVLVLLLCAWHFNSVCVVQIRDKYAVRRGVFFYQYKDLMSHTYWWERGSSFFGCCLTDDLNKAKEAYALLTDKGTKV